MGMQRPTRLAAGLATGFAAAALAAMISIPTATTAASDGAMPPQVLGLVAHHAPVPLTCEDGTCQALVSSFCLQEHRPPPGAGQVYETAGSGDVTLLVRKIDGSTREFSAAGLLTYVSDGHFTRTRIAMDSARLASLDATEVSVRIAPMVSLVPVTDTPLPAELVQSDTETAYGEARFTAADFFHPGKTRPDAAVTLTRMINTLPALMSGGVDPRAVDPFKRAVLWNSVAESGALKGLSSDGIARAKSELDRCGQYAEMGFKLTLRGCLESAHDRTMREVNDELWQAEVGY